jgi:hypothetical protein
MASASNARPARESMPRDFPLAGEFRHPKTAFVPESNTKRFNPCDCLIGERSGLVYIPPPMAKG